VDERMQNIIKRIEEINEELGDDDILEDIYVG